MKINIRIDIDNGWNIQAPGGNKSGEHIENSSFKQSEATGAQPLPVEAGATQLADHKFLSVCEKGEMP